jgi:hypothetical protein
MVWKPQTQWIPLSHLLTLKILFRSPALNPAVNIIYFWECPDRMECEPGTTSSGPIDHGNQATRTAREEEVQAWPQQSLVAPLWAGGMPVCWLGSEKQRVLVELHLSESCLAVCKCSCLGREIAVKGRKGQTPYPKVSLSHHRKPAPLMAEAICHKGVPNTHPFSGAGPRLVKLFRGAEKLVCLSDQEFWNKGS